jgi:hypothetical protein
MISMNASLGVPLVSYAEAPEKDDITNDAAKGSAKPGTLSTAWGRIKKLWKRFGPFCQDSVSQITYIVPQFIAYRKLEEMSKAESCNSEMTQFYEGAWSFTYDSAVGKRIVMFDSNQLLAACGVRYESIGMPLNLLLAFMILQQFVFVAINILKVSRREKNVLCLFASGQKGVTRFVGFESRCSPLQFFAPDSAVEEERLEHGLCRFVHFCPRFMLGYNVWCGLCVRGPATNSTIYMPFHR